MRPASLRVVNNPPNPWQSAHVEWIGEPPRSRLEVFEDTSRGVLAKNDRSGLSFDYSVNPYRGCYHGCAYCYARPTHHYLDMGAGSDFDRRLVVKRAAAQLLTEAFARRSWKGELVAFSGNTDCYQPLEASYGLTHDCLEVCLTHRNPVAIITKSALIERDIELLQRLARETYCQVRISVPFFDPKHARAIEPYVPTPARRLETIARLASAGIPTGVMVAPIIPGLNDSDVPQILGAARAAGARYASYTLLRLSETVAEVFVERLQAALPMRANRIMSQLAQCRGGNISESRFGARMRGTGARWAAIEQLFKKTADRLGFESSPDVPAPSPFRRPSSQLTLF